MAVPASIVLHIMIFRCLHHANLQEAQALPHCACLVRVHEKLAGATPRCMLHLLFQLKVFIR